MPVLLVQGELTTPRFRRMVAEEAKCLPQAKVVAIALLVPHGSGNPFQIGSQSNG